MDTTAAERDGDASRPRRWRRPPGCRWARTPGSAACCSTPTAAPSPRATTAAPAPPHAEADALRAGRGPRPGAPPRSSPSSPATTPGAPGPAPQALVAAGVRRVVFAQTRPQPGGRRAAPSTLRAAGVEVEAGLLADEAARAEPRLDLRRRARSPLRHLEVRHHARRPQRRRRRHQPLGLQHAPPAATPTGCARSCDTMLVGTGTVGRRRPAADRPRRARRRPLAAPAAAGGDGGARPRLPTGGSSTSRAETVQLRTRDPHAALARARAPATVSTSSSRAARRWPPRSCGPAWSTRSSPTSRPVLLGAGLPAVADLGITTIAEAFRPQVTDVTVLEPVVDGEQPNVRFTLTPAPTDREKAPEMFTGIVEELGTVEAVEDQGDAIRLTMRRRRGARRRRPRRLDRRQRLLPDRGRPAPTTAPGPPT